MRAARRNTRRRLPILDVAEPTVGVGPRASVAGAHVVRRAFANGGARVAVAIVTRRARVGAAGVGGVTVVDGVAGVGGATVAGAWRGGTRVRVVQRVTRVGGGAGINHA